MGRQNTPFWFPFWSPFCARLQKWKLSCRLDGSLIFTLLGDSEILQKRGLVFNALPDPLFWLPEVPEQKKKRKGVQNDPQKGTLNSRDLPPKASFFPFTSRTPPKPSKSHQKEPHGHRNTPTLLQKDSKKRRSMYTTVNQKSQI